MYVQGLVFKSAAGLEEVHLCMGCPAVERLKEAIPGALEDALAPHLPRREFGGDVRIVILSELTANTPEVRAEMRALVSRLREELARRAVKTVSGRCVTLSFNFSDDPM